MTQQITRATYLQALGLFTMAQRHMRKCDEFRKELTAFLGTPESGHIDDAIYDGLAAFDEALEREGITVEKDGK